MKQASQSGNVKLSQIRLAARAAVLFFAFLLFGFFLAGCSGGGLAGDLISGRIGAEGRTATLRVTPAFTALDSEGGQVIVEISNAGEGEMKWSASLSADWAKIEGEAEGSGNGSLTIEFEPTRETEERTLTLTVTSAEASNSPETVEFTQAGAEPVPVLEVSARNYAIGAAGGTISVSVVNNGGGELDWSASLPSSPAWVRFMGRTTGLDDGTIQIQVDANASDEARSFELTVSAEGADQSPQTLHFTQAAPEGPGSDTEFEISASNYELSPDGGDLRVTVKAFDTIVWSAEFEQGVAWVGFAGRSSGTGNGTFTIRYEPNEGQSSRSFALTVTAEGADHSPQTLHFTQERRGLTQLSLWTATRNIGAGGERIEVHVRSTGEEQVAWTAEVNVNWARFGDAAVLEGRGAAVIRIDVGPNPGTERTFTLRLNALAAVDPAPIVFRQAERKMPDTGVPMPPPPPSWYSNDCQRQSPGFEEFGGWLAQEGHYHNVSDSRVWRHASAGSESNAATLRTFSDCTDGRRTWTVDIAIDESSDTPPEFADLPVGEDVRIVLLDTVVPAIGEHAQGARHADPAHLWRDVETGLYPAYTEDGTGGRFLHVQPLGDWGYGSSSNWQSQLDEWSRNGSDMSAWTDMAEAYGWRLPSIQERTCEGMRMLTDSETSLWLLVGGYTGTGAARSIHPDSAVCGDAMELCLFAPWSYDYEDSRGVAQSAAGTAVAAAQVAAALDNVLLLWPDYDLVDLRDLVLDCAVDMGEEGPDAMWGRGVLSFSCLFTPQGGLRDPRTGDVLSGGIQGPVAGYYGRAGNAPYLLGQSIRGIDRTGRDFAYPLMQWSHRENHALLAATADRDGSYGFSPMELGGRGLTGRSAQVLANRGFSARISASGNAFGAAAVWRRNGLLGPSGLWTFRGGLAVQQEGAGPLVGTGVFRAPSTLSSAFSIEFQHSLTSRLFLDVRGQYWMTLNNESRSLWAGTQLSELRASASLSLQLGRARTVLKAQYGGGLRGRLDVAGKSIDLMRRSARQLSLRLHVPLGRPQRGVR